MHMHSLADLPLAYSVTVCYIDWWLSNPNNGHSHDACACVVQGDNA